MKVVSKVVNSAYRTKIKNDAEKICRLINAEFPAISSTKISEFSNTQKNPKFQKFSNAVFRRLKQFVRDPMWKEYGEGNETNYYLKLVNCVKKEKLANCDDYSKLYNLLGKINGIESRKAGIFEIKPSGAVGNIIDHAIHIIPIHGQKLKFEKLSKLKDVLIIDPWLGFADYAPNYERRITSEFSQFFKIPEGYRVGLDPLPKGETKITDKVIEFFKEKFPQFTINKNKSFINRQNCKQ